MPVYNFADLAVQINIPEWLLMDHFSEFETKLKAAAVNIEINFDDIPAIDRIKSLVNYSRYNVFETKQGTAIQYPHEDNVLALTTADQHWQNCSFYLKKEYNDPTNSVYVPLMKERVLGAIVETFTAILALNNGLHMHSAAINWQGNGIVFAAPSGIGKSTHAHLWKALYGVSILDGDVSACRIIDSMPFVFGLPWCGTSGEYMNSSAPLKAIVFLEQAEENRISKLEKAESVLRLISGSLLPFWSEYLMGRITDTAVEMSDKVDCYLLQCRPDYESVEIVKRCIES